jgi:four helix bundle protein
MSDEGEHRIERFEDFFAWRKARALSREIYTVTAQDGFSRDLSLKDQIRRSAVSVMANIAEGFERGRPAEFHQFLSIAKGSCAELRSHLYVALDAGHLAQNEFQRLISQADEVGRLVGGLRVSVAKRRASSDSSLITHHS